MKNITLVVLVFFSTLAAHAQTENRSTVSTTGDAIVIIKPDLVTISLGVDKHDADVESAREEVKMLCERIRNYCKKHNAELQQDVIHTFPVEGYGYGAEPALVDKKFRVSRLMTIILKDVSSYEEFMVGLNQTGITTIYAVDFKTNDFENVMSEARKKAVAAAQKSAQQLAKEFNKSPGDIISVSEYSQTHRYHNNMRAGVTSINEVYGYSPGLLDINGNRSLKPGETAVYHSVSATFELK